MRCEQLSVGEGGGKEGMNVFCYKRRERETRRHGIETIDRSTLDKGIIIFETIFLFQFPISRISSSFQRELGR
jgi:hypothetical protein